MTDAPAHVVEPDLPVARARALHEQLDAAAAATPVGDPVPRSSIDLLAQADLLGLMVPAAVGGQELPLTEIVDVYAEVSRADGSLGWCHFAADSAAAYFGAYLDDDGVAEVFADGVPLVAGQFAPNGTATVDGDDLIVTGDYQFGSGIAHASWAGAGILTQPEGDDPGAYVFACFPVGLAELDGNWDVLGLQATASWDYHVRDVRVPRRWAFDFFAPTVHRGGPLYRLGVPPQPPAGHAGWAIGVTRRILDEARAIAAGTTPGRRHQPRRLRAVPLRVRRARGSVPGRSGVGARGVRRRRGGGPVARRRVAHHGEPGARGLPAREPGGCRHRPAALPAVRDAGAARGAHPTVLPRPARRVAALLRLAGRSRRSGAPCSTRPDPAMATRGVPLDGQESAAAGLARLLGAELDVVVAEAPGIVADDDIEHLHRWRVAIRRSRSILAATDGVLDDGAIRHLRRDLRG
ncbi:MAG: CHAD domain-containing protein [Acidimicrobiales bacterium]